MTSALIVGVDAMIGSALYARLKLDGTEVHGTSHAGKNPGDIILDLAGDPKTWPPLPKADVAYFCAAVSKLDACENDPKAAHKVNVTGTLALARRLAESGAFTVFLSSNHVFDGTKPHRKAGEPPSPITEYGRQKAETEKGITGLQGAVLRLTKVIAPGDPRIGAWHKDLKEGKSVTAFADIFLSPVTLQNVLGALTSIGQTRVPGIYQISGKEDFSYFDLARAVARHTKADEARVTAGSGAAAGIPAAFRPRYSSYEIRLPQPISAPDADGIVAYSVLK